MTPLPALWLSRAVLAALAEEADRRGVVRLNPVASVPPQPPQEVAEGVPGVRPTDVPALLDVERPVHAQVDTAPAVALASSVG